MKSLLEWIGDVAGVIGIILCLVSGGARVLGRYYLFEYEIMTLFVGGIGLMVFACLAKIHLYSLR